MLFCWFVFLFQVRVLKSNLKKNPVAVGLEKALWSKKERREHFSSLEISRPSRNVLRLMPWLVIYDLFDAKQFYQKDCSQSQLFCMSEGPPHTCCAYTYWHFQNCRNLCPCELALRKKKKKFILLSIRVQKV